MINEKSIKGKVYLVGAGPGDPGLLTLKGKLCLKKADVLIYDYLVSPGVLSFANEQCEKIYAGKMSRDHHLSQDKINRLLVEYANQGKVVVRVKGGDPFIFGRGGEEALYLHKNGISFEIVPGVTAGYAVPAYAGIPLTHRSFASDIHFITGHEDPRKTETAVNWKALAESRGTLVFFMGVKNLPVIADMLQKYGMAASTPVALIRYGTSARQKTVTGTVDTIARIAEESGMSPPALIVMGRVVGLRSELRWFDKKPLFEKRIVVTRSRTQASLLVELLKEQGADVVEFPTISITPVPDFSGVHQALKQIQSYSWIIFTSVNSVEIFFEHLYMFHNDARALAHTSIASIGSATAEILRRYGIKADLIPEVFTSEGLIDAFKKNEIDVKERKILCPGSAIARDYVPEQLENMGALVCRLSLYENRVPEYDEEKIDELFSDNIDLVTFTSSSTVTNLVELLKKNNREQYISKIKGAAIGPITAATAGKMGIPVLLQAKKYTIPGLLAAMLQYFHS